MKFSHFQVFKHFQKIRIQTTSVATECCFFEPKAWGDEMILATTCIKSYYRSCELRKNYDSKKNSKHSSALYIFCE